MIELLHCSESHDQSQCSGEKDAIRNAIPGLARTLHHVYVCRASVRGFLICFLYQVFASDWLTGRPADEGIKAHRQPHWIKSNLRSADSRGSSPRVR